MLRSERVNLVALPGFYPDAALNNNNNTRPKRMLDVSSMVVVVRSDNNPKARQQTAHSQHGNNHRALSWESFGFHGAWA